MTSGETRTRGESCSSALLLAYVDKEVVYLYIKLFARYLLRVCLVQIYDNKYSIKMTVFGSYNFFFYLKELIISAMSYS